MNEVRDHERIEELIALRALGGLEPEDEAFLERETASHGPDCGECRRIAEESAEVAGRLAFALSPTPVREGLEDAVVARALSERPAGSAEAPAEELATAELAEGRERREGGGRGWWRGVAAVAAAFVLFAGGWAVRSATTPEGIDLRAASVVPFEGDEPGQLAIAYEPGREGVVLLGSGVPAPEEGLVYELWSIEDDTAVSATCFTPGSAGDVLEVLEDADIGSSDAMAVTEEATACPAAPTMAPLYVADLAARAETA